MRISKLYFIILLLLLCLLALCACSTDVPPQGSAPTETTHTFAPNDQSILGAQIKVSYRVSDPEGATLTGKTEQTIRWGETSTTVVFVRVKEGYRFVGWSDGRSQPIRENDSPTADTVYTAIIEPNVSELPSVYLTTETLRDVYSRTKYINGTIAITGCAQAFQLEKMDMEIRGRGNSSWNMEKKSYRLRLSEKKQLLGLGKSEERSWVLLANHADQSLLRNHITMEFARSLSGIDFMPQSTSVSLYLNGKYQGVYLLCEQIEVDSDRVHISENPESLYTGYFLEMTHYAQEPRFTVSDVLYEIKNDLSTSEELQAQQRLYIQNVISRCFSAVKGGNERTVRAMIDIDSVVDTYIVEELFKNKDDGWDSFYLYFDAGKEGAKLHLGPIWDFDLTGGNTDNGGEFYEGLWAGVSECITDNFWYIELMEQEWFRLLVQKRWQELKSQIDRIPSTIIAEADANTPSYERNFERWPIFGHIINQQPPAIQALDTYVEHYRYYATWMQNRIAWLDGVFNNAEFIKHGAAALE